MGPQSQRTFQRYGILKIKRLEKTFMVMKRDDEDMETSIANAGTVRTRVEFIVLGKRSIRFEHLSNCKAKL